MKTNGLALGVLYALGSFFALTGCVGYVQGEPGGVAVAEPDLFWFGGYGDGGGARDYGFRGGESRGGFGGGRR
jgi:hypothetical protein